MGGATLVLGRKETRIPLGPEIPGAFDLHAEPRGVEHRRALGRLHEAKGPPKRRVGRTLIPEGGLGNPQEQAAFGPQREPFDEVRCRVSKGLPVLQEHVQPGRLAVGPHIKGSSGYP